MKRICFAGALACAVLFTACCGNSENKMEMGSRSQFDSISYSMGVDIGYGIQNMDIPVDYKLVEKGLKEAAQANESIDREQMMETLRNYFMTERPKRMKMINEKRAREDSIRQASGDTTHLEFRPDPAMFADKAEREQVSYAFGADMGYNMRNSPIPLKLYWIMEGMNDVTNETARMTREQVNDYIMRYMRTIFPEENLKASQEWLAQIEKKPGVQKTESGLLYKIEVEGDMENKATQSRDVVKVHYKGTTRNGRVFDASRYADMPKERQEQRKKFDPENYAEDKEVEFPLNRVIKGWTEGMQLVGKGGKITLWVPADLAYGMRGNGRQIGPNEALRFDVELIDVMPYVNPADTVKQAEPAEAAK